MSDAPQKPQKPLKRITLLAVTAEDFVRFLDAKVGEDDDCPLCHTDKWTILCPGPESTYRLGLPVRNQKKEFFLSTFGYYCDSCGFLRNHLAAVVHKWVTENPAAGMDLGQDEIDDSTGDVEATDE